MTLPLAIKLTLLETVPELKIYLGESASSDRIGKAIADLKSKNKKGLTVNKVLPALEFHLSLLQKSGWNANSKLAKDLEGSLNRLRSLMLSRNIPLTKSIKTF